MVDGTWKVGTVVATQTQTPSARSIQLDVPGWPGNLAGQHVDVKLTAPDGYTAVRSYSLASAGDGTRVELAVDNFPNGEVSPYLVEELRDGDELELRGPLGGWFVWHPTDTTPVQLVGGGSGIVPLMAMIRAHAAAESTVPFRLLYSVRTPADIFFRDELVALAASPYLDVTYVYTRQTPPGWPVKAGRVSRDVVDAALAGSVSVAGASTASTSSPSISSPSIFVCGPTGFVEAVATWLVELGHDPDVVKTERFGGK
ncbi:MAG: oxidoreductase [Glaciihabitans sp.]|nr:oxidoreductase [Glaciihabitans sp.]